jgi:ATP-binding cassette subfamily B protein
MLSYSQAEMVVGAKVFNSKTGAFLGTIEGEKGTTWVLINPFNQQIELEEGRDFKTLPLPQLRQMFSVVPQDVFLFSGTVAENVAMDRTYDAGRVETALERVGALDLLKNRGKNGNFLAAPVRERGANFSAGERQLIAFARALYRDAPYLILDEATASIDSETEARLQGAVDELMRGRTALVIAHRLSTIRKADRILVFHKGKIVEQGSHDELLGLSGIYAHLHQLQFSES